MSPKVFAAVVAAIYTLICVLATPPYDVISAIAWCFGPPAMVVGAYYYALMLQELGYARQNS